MAKYQIIRYSFPKQFLWFLGRLDLLCVFSLLWLLGGRSRSGSVTLQSQQELSECGKEQRDSPESAWARLASGPLLRGRALPSPPNTNLHQNPPWRLSCLPTLWGRKVRFWEVWGLVQSQAWGCTQSRDRSPLACLFLQGAGRSARRAGNLLRVGWCCVPHIQTFSHFALGNILVWGRQKTSR